MSIKPVFELAREHKNVIVAVVAVFAAMIALAFSVGKHGADSAYSANFKFFAVAAAVAFLIRLVGHKDHEEEGQFMITGPQSTSEVEITGFTPLD